MYPDSTPSFLHTRFPVAYIIIMLHYKKGQIPTVKPETPYQATISWMPEMFSQAIVVVSMEV